MSVAAPQRFTKRNPCPICGGGDDLPRGHGRRCSGFLSDDGAYAHCTREEQAGALEPSRAEPPTFAHRLEGECRCDAEHAPAPRSGHGDTARIAATYDYVDEAGKLLYQVVRHEPKRFLQRRPDGDGGWIWNLDNTRRMLYRLPIVLGAIKLGATIYVAEGEKDVHAIEDAGAAATCNPMGAGAGKWRPEFSQALAHATAMRVVADKDDEGRRHAEKVAASLRDVGIADVEIVEPAVGKDVSDHLAAGRTLAELVHVEASETPANAFRGLRDSASRKVSSLPLVLPFSRLSEALENVAEVPDWIWADYLARGASTLFAGRPKIGKSTMLFALLRAIRQGDLFLGCETTASGVLLLSEEPLGALRQKAARFGLEHAFREPQSPRPRQENDVHLLRRAQAIGATWPQVVEQAVDYATENELGLVVLDTFDKWTGLRGDDENKTGAILGAFEPLLQVTSADLALLVITHHRKSGGKFGEGVRGANALVGAVDVVLEIDRLSLAIDPSQRGRVLTSIGRFEEVPDRVLELTSDGGYRLLGDMESVRVGRENEELIAALIALPRPATVADVAAQLDVKEATARGRLQAAFKRHDVKRFGAGKKGNPFLWALVTDDTEAEGEEVA